MTLIQTLRTEARAAPESGIVAVVNHGRLREGLIPLWAGEGDLPTPAFISDAAARGLANGETFYTWQKGIPELRQALARYYARHFGKRLAEEEFIVTASGMHAIQLAIDAIAGSGDEVIYLSPAWPNFAAAAGVAGAVPVAVTLDQSGNGWSCDVDKIASAITPRTKALFVNTPSNPTGWTADKETLQAILDLARARNLWIIADEIYSLFHYGRGRAPSFLDVATAEDQILFVNSFSKNWAMTGWRVGWIKTHPALQQVFENLIQYSTSGVAQFMQRGAVAALDGGDGFIVEQVERAHAARDLVCDILGATGKARFTVPQGAFYLFFTVDGIADSRTAAFDIVDNANVGLAPGTAFGPGGEAFLRLCFHRRLDQLEEAAHRLAKWIKTV
ncbi:MAG: aminotransferase class I/II-fold pyridoxal phosphate-dependent enzyme [Mesorhizobium sp.]|uniref:pyridoxal phosphate-dependent aminotransferase n=1 Tax=unclassified Mesorhizobium TaxID=325217 RepID=UPI000F762999|nr:MULTISPECIES: pyridoxal phosphate-dependent aminotransferase [unclassified Mesorhizobium]AZO71805.1 pyridoxal phosphate-dependent aminotransferase [Mesorhizobium sp. M1D.F.Ca.ET.043.01.1.1]RWA83236.1 MAG: aminotransferase class I/II-fold pyridoxal phosphate-dependent enzyme [Mesorhizobium sp.]RWE17120.1 MAG: aminotransferase class I/II-fold pyridoxal phosphate-dependent enzyme [Mesorhizobium sp.]TJW81822.1 MAG: aminotransferase class I/II-fold pyridoxal phosphate-dependent enzyme [Mesorhizob